MIEWNVDELKFDDNGLIPVILQDAKTKDVLTLAYGTKESIAKTIETNETWLFSRSRNELWHKGATSGHTQQVVAIRTDCDQDAIIYEVIHNGPACHTGKDSCFYETIQKPTEPIGSVAILNDLVKVIEQRENEMPEGAYTTYLFEKGIDKIGKKIGEEAMEVVIGAKNRDPEEVKWEAADLLYHLLVLLQEQKVSLYDVLGVLQKRHEGKK